MNDSYSFTSEVKFTLRIGYQFDPPNLRVTFSSTQLSPSYENSEFAIPLEWFHDEQGNLSVEKLSSFHARVATAFEVTKNEALIPDLCLHFTDIVKLLAVSYGIDGTSAAEAITEQGKQHQRNAESRLGVMMGSHLSNGGKPKRSRYWTPVTLWMAVLEAKSKLGPTHGFDYENIAAKIKEIHPDTAPPSAEALKKLVNRLGLNWKSLKAQPGPPTAHTKPSQPARKKR